MKPYTLVGFYLDTNEGFVAYVEAEDEKLHRLGLDENERPYSVLAVFNGHLDPAWAGNCERVW